MDYRFTCSDGSSLENYGSYSYNEESQMKCINGFGLVKTGMISSLFLPFFYSYYDLNYKNTLAVMFSI